MLIGLFGWLRVPLALKQGVLVFHREVNPYF